MKTNFDHALDAVKAGMSREAAAIANGLTPGNFNSMITRRKLGGTLPNRQGKAGRAAELALKDQDLVRAMQEAVERVLSGASSALSESRKNPGINPRTLADWVRKEKVRRGIPIGDRRRR